MIKTCLPDVLEKKRLQITKRHNINASIAIFFIFTVLFLFIHLLASIEVRSRGWVLGLLGLSLFLCLFFIMRFISKLDYLFCKELGFICPECHKPLYIVIGRETGSKRLMDGRCPHCNKDLKG